MFYIPTQYAQSNVPLRLNKMLCFSCESQIPGNHSFLGISDIYFLFYLIHSDENDKFNELFFHWLSYISFITDQVKYDVT